MSKIPFTLDAWLKDKSQKVETRDGRPVKIISFELTDTNDCPIAALFRLCAGTPVVCLFDKEGRYKGEGDSNYDLFLITPEPELSDFEKALEVFLMNADSSEETFHEEVKKHAAKLLSLARDQFIKDGYVIEKKAFHDAVEKVAPEVMKEVSDKVDMEEALRLGYEKGKADALKDLPRWRKCGNGACGNGRGIPIAIVKRGLNGYELVDALGIQGEQYIILSDLEKLHGFNEDEK